MSKERKLKIQVHGVSSYIRSGYGTVTRYITSLLKEAGFDIIVSSYYGIEPGGVLVINGVPQLPCYRHLGPFGEGTCEHYYRTLKRDIAILISDYWAFNWFVDRNRILRPYSYSPMDHINYPPWLQQLVGSYEGVISLCEFHRKELEKYNIPSTVIEHGVDLKKYYPMDQRKARTNTNIPLDKKVILMVGANADKEDRKAFTQAFKAIRYFLEQNPDARKDIFVHVHSVSSQSPVIIRDRKTLLIDIVPIYSLFTKWKTGYEVHNLEDIEVWANNKFTKINYISRHPLPFKSKLKRIIVPSGLIEVTESHSLFDENDIPIEVNKLKIKDKIKLVSYPWLNPITSCTRELAWILGFFVAEGSILDNKIVFYNNNVDLLQQCKEYVRTILGINSFIMNPPSTRETSRLVINSKSWARLFKEWCYVYETKSRKTKKVPKIILNSIPDIMDAFLKGYYVGDGINNNYKYEYKGFKSVSQTLLQGLLYLLSQVTGQTFNLEFDEKKNAYLSYLRSPNIRKQKLLVPNMIKKIQEIPHILRDSRGRVISHQSLYVYDLSTEDESFMAGVGKILAHNSNPQDPRGFDLNALRVREHIQDVVQLEDPFMSLTGLSDEEMCNLYNSGDVLLHPSRREGFGLCILEALACGVPVIAHDFSSMPDLVKGHGWLCKSAGLVPVGLKDEIEKMASLIVPTMRNKNKKIQRLYHELQRLTTELTKMQNETLPLLTTPILGETAVPDVYDIARCIEEAYNKEDLRMKYAKKSRKFSLKYNWEDIVKYKWIPYLEKIEEEIENKREIKWDKQFKFEGLE